MLKLGNSLSLPTVKNADYSPIDHIAGKPDIWLDAHCELQRQLQADGAGIENFVNIGNTRATVQPRQSVSANAPTYDASDASIKWESVLFDGTDDFFDFDSTYNSEDDFTFACVFQLGSPSNEAIVGGATGGLNRLVVYANSILLRFNGTGSSNGGIQLFLNNTDNGTTSYSFSDQVEVIMVRKDTSNNIHVYNKDGDKIGYYAADTKTDQPWQIDRIGHLNTSPASSFAGGRIGEWALFKNDILESKSIAVAEALYKKWKV